VTSFNVLVIGDSCIDEYRYGYIDRLNPEAPVPLLSLGLIEQKLGMASNVANNLKAFGVQVTLETPETPSKKIRYIDKKTGKHLLRVDQDIVVNPYLFINYGSYDAVIISDYNKGFVDENVIRDVANNFSGPVFVDTKKTSLASYPNVFYKINQIEESRLKSIPKNLIVTLGSAGCLYEGQRYPTLAVDSVDVCGAGDVFLAALTFGYLSFKSIPAAIRLANKAAALSCQHLGTYTLTEQDIKCVF
jgi:bifunctional ADP-heptose synthase (sugar kinase/adenylyltransferase)